MDLGVKEHVSRLGNAASLGKHEEIMCGSIDFQKSVASNIVGKLTAPILKEMASGIRALYTSSTHFTSPTVESLYPNVDACVNAGDAPKIATLGLACRSGYNRARFTRDVTCNGGHSRANTF